MKETILGIVRHGLTAGGGVLITKGVADATDIQTAVGAIVTLAGVAWSIWSKRKSAKP